MYRWKIVYSFSILTSLLINRWKNPLKKNYRRILVMRHDEIGDMITTLPVFTALREKYPESEITVWCSLLTKPLIENNPAINFIVTNKNELHGSYDLIIDLRGNSETLWYAFMHQPYYRLDRGTIRLKNKFSLPEHPLEVFTNLQIITPVIGNSNADPVLKIYLTKKNQITAKTYLNDNRISTFCIFHTAARNELKRWPAIKFAGLAKEIKKEYGWDIVMVGTPSELNEIQKIQSMIPFKTYSFTGFSLTDFAALASMAACFIGNDSGPMHIASAMDIPVVGLFGAGESHTFAPYGRKATYIHHKLECYPCDTLHCVRADNPCINLIQINEVLEKVRQVTEPVSLLQ
ncbi:MAG: glycosyltransferase family 9 protein [Bacteroidia bacterium]|nr:glycosyltransferase family 9 protein [Bacteroidia bacterium]MCZ2277873.1 glycosyltransferase family 9 protein [Bacteroidia bacterium]